LQRVDLACRLTLDSEGLPISNRQTVTGIIDRNHAKISRRTTFLERLHPVYSDDHCPSGRSCINQYLS
jgi:hypothetical protein